MELPFRKLIEWLVIESTLAKTSIPYYFTLATAGKQGIPHSRIVAAREINKQGILFFTQRYTKKAVELAENPVASATFWCPQQNREIIVDGTVETLTEQENQFYWQSLPRERQLRFATYGPTSTQAISSISELEAKQQILSQQFSNKEIPMSESYCGFRLQPEIFYFYTLGQETFSEFIQFSLKNGTWKQQLLSP